MRAAIAVAAGLLLIGSLPANAAQALRGNALVGMCKSPDSGICAAYFIGFISGALMSDAEWGMGKPLCLSGVSAKSLKTAFLRFAAQHPHLMDRHADSLVATAAARSFRCKLGRHR